MENVIKQFERLSHNLMENKKEVGISEEISIKQLLKTQKNSYEYNEVDNVSYINFNT